MQRTFAAATIALLVGCGPGQTPSAPSTLAVPPPAAPVNQAAAFDITFTADNACTSLPIVARKRTYSVDVVRDARTISLRGGTFGQSSDPAYPSMWNVIYQNAADNAAAWWFQDPEIWEHLNADTYVVIFGGPARIAVDPGTLNPQTGDTEFWGRFAYCGEAEPDSYPECEVPEITCESSHHTLTLVRR